MGSWMSCCHKTVKMWKIIEDGEITIVEAHELIDILLKKEDDNK